ncbi:hypothetical protein HDU90_001925 [Geranomyces variabilis]|nr:hypothetical protein HDU90_001925 [Geranomyces variabilis]
MPRRKHPARGRIPKDGVVLSIDNDGMCKVKRVEGNLGLKAELLFAKLLASGNTPKPLDQVGIRYLQPQSPSPRNASPSDEVSNPHALQLPRAADSNLSARLSSSHASTPRTRSRTYEARAPSPRIQVASSSPKLGLSPRMTPRRTSPLPPQIGVCEDILIILHACGMSSPRKPLLFKGQLDPRAIRKDSGSPVCERCIYSSSCLGACWCTLWSSSLSAVMIDLALQYLDNTKRNAVTAWGFLETLVAPIVEHDIDYTEA